MGALYVSFPSEQTETAKHREDIHNNPAEHRGNVRGPQGSETTRKGGKMTGDKGGPDKCFYNQLLSSNQNRVE